VSDTINKLSYICYATVCTVMLQGALWFYRVYCDATGCAVVCVDHVLSSNVSSLLSCCHSCHRRYFSAWLAALW